MSKQDYNMDDKISQELKDELAKKAENFVNRIGNGKQQGFAGYNQVPNLVLQYGGILGLNHKQKDFLNVLTSHINNKNNGNGKSKIQWDKSSWVSIETISMWSTTEDRRTDSAIEKSLINDGYLVKKGKKLYPARYYAALDSLYDLIEKYEKDIIKSRAADRENRTMEIISSFQENLRNKIIAEYREWAIPRGYLQETLTKEEKMKTDGRKKPKNNEEAF